MRKNLLLSGIIMVCSLMMNAQTQQGDYKIVFDMSSGDTINHRAVVREISLITGYRPDAKMEVTVYGEAISMVVKGKSKVATEIEDLTKNKKAVFKVCAFTMKRNNVDASQLVPGVEIVPDGIFEIYSKQKEGYGYIKVGH